ncbi:short-chain collagen C4-like, partial [Octopus sinensis]|uniref:Short-chain collagen C4-like n=1 Tax=Octopus sinensis TaxID=2607531 RepID=A0A7E6FGE6_9MOLL
LYTRWGRTSCPPYSNIVYDGLAGGEWFDNAGGGSNLLCLPNDPIWANYTTEHEGGSWIHGTEYQLEYYTTNKLFSFANAKSLHDHNVPCAVCLTQQPAVVMMLPARTKCYPGWTIEYSGYLMTEGSGNKGRHEYVCVDYAPEADPAGYKNNGASLYFVQAACGSLPCPPYVNGQELSCVVCSKY